MRKLSEIQGLRAVAVLIVLIFHVWPNALGGGYVGVDVFFVISGYLITGLLLKEAEHTGRVSLMNFYARRIRRLLPASTLVILAVAASIKLLPVVQWPNTAIEIFASVFYVQNWWLADQSVDYLAEGNAVGLLRHYWSLSIEEQYYIVWPIIFLAVIKFSTKARNNPRAVFGFIIGFIALISLFYSVYLTEKNPPLAYFVTGTRAWELAIGGLLTVLSNYWRLIPAWLRALAGWLGLLMIAVACVVFNKTTAFPGFSALLPTVGAVLVLVGGRTGYFWSNDKLLACKPLQYFGDISYSLYLWHWPVVVLYGLQVEGDLSLVHGIAVLVISIVLAHLTKIFVEDPFRYQRFKKFPFINHASGVAISSFALALFAANLIWMINEGSNSGRENRLASKTYTEEEINLLLAKKYNPQMPTVPDVRDARKDTPEYEVCRVTGEDSEPRKCVYGNEKSPEAVIALVGDSHSVQWLPALESLLDKNPGWQIVVYYKSGCAFNALEVLTATDQPRPFTSCTLWNQRVMEELKILKPEVVVTTQASGYQVYHEGVVLPRDKSQAILADGLIKRWDELSKLDINIVVVRDTPWMSKDVPQCLSKPRASYEKCATPTDKALRIQAVALAMDKKPPVIYMDLSKEICEEDYCWPTKGQILIWRDRHHLSATFSGSLGHFFDEPIKKALGKK